jgi:hypothetical protein
MNRLTQSKYKDFDTQQMTELFKPEVQSLLTMWNDKTTDMIVKQQYILQLLRSYTEAFDDYVRKAIDIHKVVTKSLKPNIWYLYSREKIDGVYIHTFKCTNNNNENTYNFTIKIEGNIDSTKINDMVIIDDQDTLLKQLPSPVYESMISEAIVDLCNKLNI